MLCTDLPTYAFATVSTELGVYGTEALGRLIRGLHCLLGVSRETILDRVAGSRGRAALSHAYAGVNAPACSLHMITY